MAITQYLRIPLVFLIIIGIIGCESTQNQQTQKHIENLSQKSRLFHWKPATQHSYLPEKLHFLISGAPGALLAGKNYPDLHGLPHDYQANRGFNSLLFRVEVEHVMILINYVVTRQRFLHPRGSISLHGQTHREKRVLIFLRPLILVHIPPHI